MELIELLIIFIAWLFGAKKKPEQGDQQRHHRIEPGTDLEGARPKIDRYGLDHAVPVLVYEVGPDNLVQMARKRAGDKRRIIEKRLEEEEAAREDADAQERGAVMAAVETPQGVDAYALKESHRESRDEPPTHYPYAFQQEAKVTHRVVPVPQFKAAVVANTAPIEHRVSAGGQVARRKRQRDSSLGVIRLLTTPKSLAQVVKAKVILDPPPAFTDARDHFRS